MMRQSHLGFLSLVWLAAGGLILASNNLKPTAVAHPDMLLGERYYVVAHPGFALGLPSVFGVFALIYFGLKYVSGVRVRPALACAHLGVTFTGACLMSAPAIILASADMAKRHDNPIEGFSYWNHMVGAGYGLIIVGLAMFIGLLIEGLRAGRRN